MIWNGSLSASFGSNATIANSSGWMLATTTYDGSTLKLYINGELDNSMSTTVGVGSPASYNAAIGGMGFDPATYTLDGKIDDVRLYNRALSIEEIRSLYKLGSGN
jgi:hypothetical protein